MKIRRIIEIEEKDYEAASKVTISLDGAMSIYNAIRESKPYNPSGDLISREALKKEVENLVVGGEEGLKDYYENGSKSDENSWIGGVYDTWELINSAPTVEPERPQGEFTRKELESWLYRIAGNNLENELGRSCEEIINRLDGFERFVSDMRKGGAE